MDGREGAVSFQEEKHTVTLETWRGGGQFELKFCGTNNRADALRSGGDALKPPPAAVSSVVLLVFTYKDAKIKATAGRSKLLY